MRLFRMKGKSEAGEEEKELVLDTEAEAESDAPADPLVTEVRPTPEVEPAERTVEAPEGAPAPQDDLFAQIGAEADAEIAAEEAAAAEETAATEDAAATEGKPPSGDDELDPDLLDIFRDARSEVEESTLASELEDISAQELLKDVAGIGYRLGISPEGPAGRADGEVGEPSGDDEGQVKPDEHQEP